MTLIPLISAIVAAPEAMTAPAGPTPLRRDSYDPGAGHRPVAALLAFGLPALLVAGVALSPMIIDTPPRSDPQDWTTFTLPKPPPPEPSDAKPQAQPREPTLFAPPTPLPPLAPDPVEATPQPPYVPPAGSGTGTTVIADPPLPPAPPLVLAKLDPRFASAFQPDYPATEQRRGVEGVARVRVLIGIDGRVKAVELVSTDSQGFFDETKRRALAKWRFKPATRGGVAEESWQVMTVRFQIRDA